MPEFHFTKFLKKLFVQKVQQFVVERFKLGEYMPSVTELQNLIGHLQKETGIKDPKKIAKLIAIVLYQKCIKRGTKKVPYYCIKTIVNCLELGFLKSVPPGPAIEMCILALRQIIDYVRKNENINQYLEDIEDITNVVDSD